MKFPESWLREHVTVSASRDELSARLTAIGLEVEDAQVLEFCPRSRPIHDSHDSGQRIRPTG